jgi:putative ABC transport system permease protein
VGTKLRPSHGFDHDGDEPRRHAFEFTVVGRMPATGTPWDEAVLVPIEAMWRVHHRDDAGSSAIVVAPRTVGDAYRLRQSARAKGLLAVFPAEVLVDLYSVLGGARDLVLILARSSQALVVAAVLLALLARVEARRASSAVLRALGAPASYVFAVTWLQCFALFAAGAGAGIAAGWILAQGAAGVLAQLTGIDIAVGLRAAEWRETALQLAALAAAATLPAFVGLAGSVPEGLRAT